MLKGLTLPDPENSAAMPIVDSSGKKKVLHVLDQSTKESDDKNGCKNIRKQGIS